MSDDPMDYVIPGVRRYEYDYMREYTRDVTDDMELRDWTVSYFLVPPALGELRNNGGGDRQSLEIAASVEVNPYCREFCLWLPPSWYANCRSDKEEDLKQARQTLCHELTHVHLKRVDRLHESLYTNLGEAAYGIFDSLYTVESEHVVNIVADLACRGIDLPKMPKKPPLERKSRPRGGAMDPNRV